MKKLISLSTLSKCRIKSIAVGLLFLLSIPHAAQAGFIANFHENVVSGNNSLFIFGAENTVGTLSSNDGLFENFIIDSSGVFERNFGPNGQAMSFNGINGRSIFVDSNDSISGIALNRATATSDQTNLLDVDALGTEYIALSYNGSFGDGSQLSVTAVEDNTLVTITSPTVLNGNPANTPFQQTLQAGESIFFESGGGGDVSGTQISSSNSVAVFTGAECTNIPSNLAACDHLIAQQFSVDNFDTEFQIVENFGAGPDGDLIRVLTATDGTQVFLDGVSQGIINAGEFLEIDNVGNSILTSSEPVTVGQFIRGQNGTRTTGDPAFAIIPSVNQTLENYVFATPSGGDGFSENYLNIAIDQSLASSLLLDGLSVDTSGFDVIGDMLFGNVSIGQGIGNVSADDTFFATTSGFSNFDSFFNPIATSFSTGASPNPTPNPVPEPFSVSLLGIGLIGLVGLRRRNSRTVR